MNHWQARGRVAALLDGTLPAATDQRVRTHVARCPRCRDVLRELEASEALLRRLPAALLPREPSPAAEARLAALARWAAPAPAAAAGASPIQAALRPARALAAAAALALMMIGGDPSEAPGSGEPFNFVLASAALEQGAFAHVRQQRALVPAAASHASPDLYLLPVGLR